jgi:hypothetical protein
MKQTFQKLILLCSMFLVCFLSLTPQASALSKKRGTRGAFAGGAFSAGAGIAYTTAEQNGINSMIDSAKTAVNSSAGKLSSGLEYVGYGSFRFANGFTAAQLRVSYFTQNSSGSGTDGSQSYDLTGFTIFPMARFIPLSNDLIDFYLQGGLGYGKLDGSIVNGTKSAKFSGSAFGMQVGLGAEFCFVPDHCFNVEGNYRYLPIERNVVSSGTGPGNLPYGTSQASANNELEDLSGRDIATTMSGVQGLVSYTYNF